MIIVGYYTADSPYQECAWALEQDLYRLQIPYHIEAQDHRGSWLRNIIIKGDFCRWMLAFYAESAPVVFLDADARVRQYPSLFEELTGSCDVAMGYLDHPRERWLSNVIAMWPTDGCRRFLDAWAERNLDPATHHGPADEDNLPWAIERSGASAYRLPPEYACVADMQAGPLFTRGKHPDIEPVIEQMQASRRHKGDMNVRE